MCRLYGDESAYASADIEHQTHLILMNQERALKPSIPVSDHKETCRSAVFMNAKAATDCKKNPAHTVPVHFLLYHVRQD